MSMLRKKKSTFDESDLPTDNWIWGNTRGGGGAPLKDVQGNDVANLKKVLTGTIEVDHSPSPNGKARRNPQPYRESEYDDREGSYNSKQNSRNPPANAPNRNGNNRNRQGGYDSNNDEDYDRRGGHNDHNHRNNHDSRNNGNKPRYNPYSDEAPERVIPGLNDHHSPVRHPNNNHRNQNNAPNGPVSPRYVDNNNGASPKKFMGALRELTGGSNAERDAKQRKQAEYQEMLRQQIEENNRKKEKEKREQDEVKRRELAEFMSTQGVKNGAKANSAADEYPSTTTGAANNNKRNPVQGRFRADSDDYNNHNNNNSNSNNNNEKIGSKMPALNIGGGGGNANKRGNNVGGRGNNNYYSEEDQDEPPARRGQGGPDKGRQVPGISANRRRSSSYDSDPDQDQGYPPRRNNNNIRGQGGNGGGYDSEGSGDSRNNNRGGGRGGGGRGRGSVSSAMSEDVVPVEEYDELSKLVDKLLTEKAQLQLAVEKQADQLKALKGGKAAPSTNPRNRLVSSPSKPAVLARSKSAMQPRAGARGAKDQLDLPIEEPPARAASNLRTSKKELDRERAREARAHLKEYEPVKKNAAGGAANKARPSSMHAIGGSKGYVDEAGQPKKAVKVAFGSNRNLDKNNAGGSNRLAQQGASVLNSAHGNNKNKLNSPSKDNTAQGRYGQGGVVKPGRVSAGGSMGERDNIGINGFAKLQQANSRVVGGPVMVVHEDEEPSGRGNKQSYGNNYGDNARTPSPLQKGRGGNARMGSLELRGNSEYIPIDNNKDVIGNDQLERLLRQSRNAR